VFHKKNDTTARQLITVSDTKSLISEQFRTIRTNITYARPDVELKTILITSTSPGEGKSTNAANLAVVFAQEGKRVLLIDADMRKPTLHVAFDYFNVVGLSSVLTNKSKLTEAIRESPIMGLWILTSGSIPPNPAELLASQVMEETLRQAKELFDIIILDAPPLLSVTDAQILSHLCDGTLLIAHAARTEKEALVKAKTMLMNSQATILGVVLNQYKASRRHTGVYDY